MTTYRAAYVNDTALTGPEHSGLSDEELIAEAIAELKRTDSFGTEWPRVSGDAIVIGEWS